MFKTIGNKIKSIFELEAKSLENKVGPGSYIPIQVTVNNPENYFLSDSLTVIISPELTGDNVREVLLKPKQKKNIFWIIKIPEDIDKNYLYTTKFTIVDLFGEEASTNIEYGATYSIISLQEAEAIIKTLSVEEEKTYSIDLQLNCNTVKPYYYDYETFEIKCNLKNTGNTLLKNLNVCLETNCNQLDLRIGQEKEVDFILNEIKENRVLINAKNSNLDLNNVVVLKVFNEPDLKIINLGVPEEVGYKENFELILDLNSEVIIKDLNVKLNNHLINIDEFQNSKKIEIQVAGKDFTNGKIEINLNYKDENGNSYMQKKEFPINVTNIPFFARIIVFFRNLFQ